jgi:hypothetical protein
LEYRVYIELDITDTTTSLRVAYHADSTDSVLAHRIPYQIDLTQLAAAQHLPEQYGALLTDALFADPRMCEAWRRVAENRASHGSTCTVALRIAEPMRVLTWETLLDPLTRIPLALTAWCRLYRTSWGDPYAHASRAPLANPRLLLLLSNPLDGPNYGYAALPSAQIQRQIRAHWRGDLTVLARNAPIAPTISMLHRALAMEHPTILLVMGHGNARGGMVLEYGAGQSAHHDARMLHNLLVGLPSPPTLGILITCHSVGSRDQDIGIANACADALPHTVGIRGLIRINDGIASVLTLLDHIGTGAALGEAVYLARLHTQQHWHRLVAWSSTRSGTILPDPTALPAAATQAQSEAVQMQAAVGWQKSGRVSTGQ